METAHRAGIIHRDIKPANILFTTYRRPVLADFGISAMSVPENDDDDGHFESHAKNKLVADNVSSS